MPAASKRKPCHSLHSKLSWFLRPRMCREHAGAADHHTSPECLPVAAAGETVERGQRRDRLSQGICTGNRERCQKRSANRQCRSPYSHLGSLGAIADGCQGVCILTGKHLHQHRSDSLRDFCWGGDVSETTGHGRVLWISELEWVQRYQPDLIPSRKIHQIHSSASNSFETSAHESRAKLIQQDGGRLLRVPSH